MVEAALKACGKGRPCRSAVWYESRSRACRNESVEWMRSTKPSRYGTASLAASHASDEATLGSPYIHMTRLEQVTYLEKRTCRLPQSKRGSSRARTTSCRIHALDQ